MLVVNFTADSPHPIDRSAPDVTKIPRNFSYTERAEPAHFLPRKYRSSLPPQRRQLHRGEAGPQQEEEEEGRGERTCCPARMMSRLETARCEQLPNSHVNRGRCRQPRLKPASVCSPLGFSVFRTEQRQIFDVGDLLPTATPTFLACPLLLYDSQEHTRTHTLLDYVCACQCVTLTLGGDATFAR